MKKTLLLLLFCISLTSVSSQKKQDRNGNLIGYIQKSDFQNQKFKSWFEPNYDKYQPNEKIIKKIKKNLKNITIKSFVGTWCHDSKRVIPRLYKTLEMAGFDFKNNAKMVGITRGKKTPDNLQEGYDIKHTPTIIFYKNGKEIGRFVEHARQTLEKDILKILKGKKYKHSYQK
ncbi:MAG: thioredoxin family protein [Flavobacteriaceae bacterium]